MDLAKSRSMVLVLALTAALVLAVVLAQQKRALLDRNENLTTRIRYPYPGLYVPAVTLPSVSGDSVLLGQAPPGQVQLLFVFSTTCEFCKASIPAWKQLGTSLSAIGEVDVYGISLDSVAATRSYLQHHDIEFQTVSFTDRRMQALYRAGITPQTLIIDGEGKVGYARIGALTKAVAIDSVLVGAKEILSKATEGHLDIGTTQ